jgi:hypothetical protein
MSEIWDESLAKFTDSMHWKLLLQIKRKGKPTKVNLISCSKEYLLKKLQEHLELNHYIDVANYAFLLSQKIDVKAGDEKQNDGM